MLNKNSINEVNNSKIGEFTIPLYNSYCFSNIFGTIKNLFGLEDEKSLPKDTIKKEKECNKVIFFLVDAFGWKFYSKYKNKSKVLSLFEEKGIVSKLTAQFPSSTSGEITTALTNLDVNNHGIGDWYYYEPMVDDNITAFLFKSTFLKGNENLKNLGIKPEDFLPKESFFSELLDNGIKTISYQNTNLNSSSYSKYMFRDANLKNFNSYEDLKEKLLEDLKRNNEKEYYYIYLPKIDSIGHEFGDTSKNFEEEVENFLIFLDSFYEEIKDSIENSVMLLSADHGQIESDLDDIIYLNLEIENIYKYLKRNKRGDIYSPCGYYRDVFLHVKEEYIDELKEILKKHLEGKALVFTIEECEKLNIFKNLTKKAKKRIGDIIILPLRNKCIWFYEEGMFSVNVKGVHGGLSKDEIEIPFLYIDI